MPDTEITVREIDPKHEKITEFKKLAAAFGWRIIAVEEREGMLRIIIEEKI